MWAGIEDSLASASSQPSSDWTEVEAAGLVLYRRFSESRVPGIGDGGDVLADISLAAAICISRDLAFEALRAAESNGLPPPSVESVAAETHAAAAAAARHARAAEAQRRVRALAAGVALLSALDAADFHRLVRTSRALTFERDDVVFDPRIGTAADATVLFLVSGDVRVVQRSVAAVTSVLMAPGACFGSSAAVATLAVDGEDSGGNGGNGSCGWTAVAATPAAGLQVAARELVNVMPITTLRALRRQLTNCLQIANRPPVAIVASRADALPLPSVGPGRPVTSTGFHREAPSPGLLLGGSPEMRHFFARVAAGLVRPDRSSSSPALLNGAEYSFSNLSCCH